MTTSAETLLELTPSDQAAVEAALAMLRTRGDLDSVPVNLDRIRKRENLLVVIEQEHLTFGFVRDHLREEHDIEIDGQPDRRSLEGYIYVDPWLHLIFLNILPGERDHQRRERYSYAHELGHYFLDALPTLEAENEEGFRLGCSYGDVERPRPIARSGVTAERAFQIERRANRFAAELLIPRDDLRAFVTSRRLSLELIGEIAERYQTSFRAAAFRLIEVTDEPCALVITNTKSEVGHWALSAPLQGHEYYRLRKGTSIGQRTSAWRMANRHIGDRRPIIGPHDANQWFPNAPAHHPRILEMTQGFRRYNEFMSLLHFDRGILPNA